MEQVEDIRQEQESVADQTVAVPSPRVTSSALDFTSIAA
jgi:hypothetical protein